MFGANVVMLTTLEALLVPAVFDASTQKGRHACHQHVVLVPTEPTFPAQRPINAKLL
jgi:hypothetical protein